MKLKEITSLFENFAPLSYQESYDNSGLIIGNNTEVIKSVLLSIDVTEDVIDEAIKLGSNLIISHHPLIFNGIKKINDSNNVQRIIRKCIKNDICVYSAHTNIDSVLGGVNSKICDKLQLENRKILSPLKNDLKKIVTFVPTEYAEKVRFALFEAGTGNIGNYDLCSYNTEGLGTFRGLENTNQFIGEKGKLHFEKEIKIETIVPSHLLNGVIESLIKAHPYEEVAYDIYSLDNINQNIGLGMYGYLPKEISAKKLFDLIKKQFNLKYLKYTGDEKASVRKIAVCGGSGSQFIKEAKSINADIFISADFKYHQFFESDNKPIIVDIGHFESEQFTVEVFYDILKKNIPNFTVYLSQINTNPIKYY